MKYLPRECLRDMVNESKLIRGFVAGMTYETFVADVRTVRAVTRSLEIIGEACRKLPKDFRDGHGQVPWRKIAGMRDRLIHDYKAINYRIVREAVQDELPALEIILEQLIEETKT